MPLDEMNLGPAMERKESTAKIARRFALTVSSLS
jgi:hypothetical protein